MDTRAIGRIACIGTGTVGASWAAFFLSRGLDVLASDPGPDAEQLLRARVDAAWPALEALGLVEGASRERLAFVTDPGACAAGADFVQESAPEREELKVALLAMLDEAVDQSVIIASSSSGLLASRLAASMRHPERLVIGHPFNPPHLMPLVEVVGGEATSPAVLARALELYRFLGKHPIEVRKEVVGHVANRIQAAIFREALHLLHSGVASLADIDAAVLYGPGLRWALMGPFLTFHLAGGEGGMAHFLEHLTEPYNAWFADLGDAPITDEDAPLLLDGIAEEVAGRSMEELTRRRDEALVKLLSGIEPL